MFLGDSDVSGNMKGSQQCAAGYSKERELRIIPGSGMAYGHFVHLGFPQT